MSLNGNWSGKIIGTNIGNISIEISENNNRLFGKLNINDLQLGISNFYFEGIVQGHNVNLEMHPMTKNNVPVQSSNVMVNGQAVTITMPEVSLGVVKASGTLNNDLNKIEGNWSSTIGTAGTFYIERNEKLISENNIKNAFVIMAIKQKAEDDDILQSIKRASESKGIMATRVDDINHSGKITPLITNGIKNSKYIICEISEERPNVYYELGYAHGLNKEVILIAKEGTKLHFDIKDYNVIFYNTLSQLERELKNRL